MAIPASQAASTPRQIGPYPIDSRLSHGGMAAVYRAYDRKRRFVALKVATEGNTAALHAEAETLRQLDHPSIVKILPSPISGQPNTDYIQSDLVEGRPASFIALEYLDGGSLEHLVVARRKRGRTFAPREILQIVEAIADALDYAHARGVLHLDVKPSNVLLSRDGRRVVLSDFGIGRRADLEGARTSVGTPLYMSPEQAQGQDVDYRSDLYSLGVVLYQLCTGRVAHDGTWDEVLRMLRVGAPIVPPAKARRGLLLDVQNVLIRALDRDRNRRFENGAALVAALRRALPSTRRRPESATIRLALAVIALALAAATVLAGTSRPRAGTIETTPVAEVTRASPTATATQLSTTTTPATENPASTLGGLPATAGTPTIVIVDPLRSGVARSTPTSATTGDVPATATLAAIVPTPSSPSPAREPIAGPRPSATPMSTPLPWR